MAVTSNPSAAAAPLADAAPLVFDAVLRPHRSLGPRGFAILMILLGTVSFAAGIGFVTLGAWPVMGFLGLDVALVYVAFRLNYRSGRDYETVQLTETTLHVARRGPLGVRESHAFQAHWVRVEIDNAAGHDSRLRLTSHGRSITIGAFLTPDERCDFARALRAELARLCQPDFSS